MQTYYQLIEISKEEADNIKATINVYKKSRKYYTLNWGHEISTLAADHVTILYNTEIDGVIAATDEEDAVAQLGLTIYT